MDKIYREVRCVSIEKNDVKFIPENLVKKPGYLIKHGLTVQELPEKATETKAEIVDPTVLAVINEPALTVTKEEAKKEDTEKKAPKPEKIKVDA